MKTFFEAYSEKLYPSIYLGSRDADICLDEAILHFRYERRAHEKLSEIITFYIDSVLYTKKKEIVKDMEGLPVEVSLGESPSCKRLAYSLDKGAFRKSWMDDLDKVGLSPVRWGFASSKKDFESRLKEYIKVIKLEAYEEEIFSFFQKDLQLISTGFITHKKVPVKLKLSRAEGQIFDYLKTHGQTHLNELVNNLHATYGKTEAAYYKQISLSVKQGTLINNNDAISINYDVAELY